MHPKIQLVPHINLHDATAGRRSGGSNSFQPPPSPNPVSRLSSLRHLLDTPPPSPALPSLTPQHGKKKPARYIRRSHKVALWTCGIATVMLYWLSRVMSRSARVSFDLGLPSQDGRGLILPAEPAPAVVVDGRGRWRWTVSIPPARSFPLRPSEYASICSNVMEIAEKTDMLRQWRTSVSGMPMSPKHGHHGHFDYYHVDPLYIDVSDAAKQNVFGSHFQSHTADNTCERSLTYVLESGHAAFGRTLLGLWQAYGLAKREGRSFFVDDTNWAYGKYETYFKPAPDPGCRPPPANERVPCPHHAKHLVVSSATTSWTFGHEFNEQFEDARKMEVQRQHEIFAMLRTGYEALFKLADDDALSLKLRRDELQGTLHQQRKIVGVHVRRGDRHPYEFQYGRSYIPTDRFVATAKELLGSDASRIGEKDGPILLVSSDDPDVYSDSEIVAAGAQRAQSKFVMASKSAMHKLTDNTASDRSKLKTFAARPMGWEGGFYSNVFWNIGKQHVSTAASTLSPTAIKSASSKQVATENTAQSATTVNKAKDELEHPSKQVMQLRSLLGRAYLLDLAVMSSTAQDGIVCTLSSAGCRVLAVMMGWEKAIDKGLWRNIDGEWSWRGVEW